MVAAVVMGIGCIAERAHGGLLYNRSIELYVITGRGAGGRSGVG